LKQGDTFSEDGVALKVLWPEDNSDVPAAKNDDSLVLRLRYGNQGLLLPGDAEKESEHTMLAENAVNELRADVLKIGHHGSKNSTMSEFLAAVQPRIGIISSGEGNPYGHPSPELLERLEKAGVRVYRTDRDGAVHVLTDGARLKISCFVECPEARSVMGSSMRAEIPNQKQDGEKK
jgi:competence protein ComEC